MTPRVALGMITMALAITTAQPLLAQRSEGPSPLRGDTAVRTARAERRVLESIVFEAEPRSFQVVRVPIPQLVRNASAVTYEIEPAAAFSIVGRRAGVLADHADLLVTVRVPADAHAGPHMAAHALFRAGNLEVDVPIETRVRPVYRTRLNVEPTISGVHAGDRLEMRVAVANIGNATDTVRVAFELPLQWNAHVRDTVLIVPRGEVGHKLLRVSIPKATGTGSFFIRTSAYSRAGATSAVTTVAVGAGAAYVAPPGPIARFSLGGVGVQDGGSAGIAQLAVSGPLTNAIQIDARIATQPSTNPGGIRGLSRVGSYITEPHLAAWTSAWRLGLGSTVVSFSEVMGVNAGGRGAALELDDQTNQLRVAAARPVSTGQEGSPGSVFGVDYARRFNHVLVGGSVSRLRGNSFGVQTLDAAGVRAVVRPAADYNVEGALAYRDYAQGDGIGWIAGVSGKLPRSRASLRFVHAPGGTDAFARAENEVLATVQTHVNDRIGVLTTYFDTDNTDISGNAVKTKVFSLTPSFRYSDRASLRGELRASQFEIAGSPFSFDNSELHFGVGATAHVNGINYSTDAAVDRLTRGVQTPDLETENSGQRFMWRGSAARLLTYGMVQIEGLYERNDRNIGFVPEQLSLMVRADRIQLRRLPSNLTLDGEIGFSRWTDVRSFATMRAGANYMFTSATELSASIERNPLMYTSRTSTPVVFAVRLERSFGLPRMNVGRAAGIVFQDYNGNGRRDADEPGMPNIRIRRGDTHATTDGEGRYRFWEEGRGPTVVDATTLPYGWIVNDRIDDGFIALTPTTRVEVTIQLGAAERLRNVDVTQLVVTARDTAGRIFIARRNGRELALFDALPVGSYELGIDAAGMPEPMRVDGVPPRVSVTRESVTRVSLPVAGRPLRFKQDAQ